jgi:flagellar biosynthetic protein FliQ
MNIDQVSSLLQETITLALTVAAPFLLGALVTGLSVSVFQAATQINEQTLTFVPKIVVVLGTFAVLFPWMFGQIVEFGTRLITNSMGGGGP